LQARLLRLDRCGVNLAMVEICVCLRSGWSGKRRNAKLTRSCHNDIDGACMENSIPGTLSWDFRMS
jgi:hypothetical protein